MTILYTVLATTLLIQLLVAYYLRYTHRQIDALQLVHNKNRDRALDLVDAIVDAHAKGDRHLSFSELGKIFNNRNHPRDLDMMMQRMIVRLERQMEGINEVPGNDSSDDSK